MARYRFNANYAGFADRGQITKCRMGGRMQRRRAGFTPPLLSNHPPPEINHVTHSTTFSARIPILSADIAPDPSAFFAFSAKLIRAA